MLFFEKKCLELNSVVYKRNADSHKYLVVIIER